MKLPPFPRSSACSTSQGRSSRLMRWGVRKRSRKPLPTRGRIMSWRSRTIIRRSAEEVTLFLNDARDTGFADIAHAYHETVDGDHGRIETRRYWITSEIEWLGAKASWSNLHSVGMVEARREVGDTVQVETRYFLTSLPAQGVRFAQAVRQHWGIENSLHWVLDVSFDEDACRIRKDKGAQTFAVLRHIALNLLRREPHHKRGIKARRKRAGWDRDYLFQVLTV